MYTLGYWTSCAGQSIEQEKAKAMRSGLSANCDSSDMIGKISAHLQTRQLIPGANVAARAMKWVLLHFQEAAVEMLTTTGSTQLVYRSSSAI